MSERYCLYVPKMWLDTTNKLLDASAAFRSETLPDIFEVSKSGILEDFYKTVRKDTKEELSVCLLPVAHCALNKIDQGLKVIGPAIATRNDIFLFRRTGERRKVQLPFVVGTKELDLTTSNLFRVAASLAAHDMFFYSDDAYLPSSLLDKSLDARTELINNIKCEEENSPSKRFKFLLEGIYDAAVFMGEDLTVRHPTTKKRGLIFGMRDVVDVLNLNTTMITLRYSLSTSGSVLRARPSSRDVCADCGGTVRAHRQVL